MKPIIVAEFTTNHMGNLNVLLRMVEEAAKAGADYIKMQKKDVETFYSQDKLNSQFLSPYGKTYRDYRTIFEFDLESFKIFDNHCKQHNIKWFTTVQDTHSVEFFSQNFSLDMVKIASINSKNIDLFKHIKKYFPNTPIVISIGGTEIEDIDKIVSFFDDRTIYIQQCTSTYPCPISNLNLGNITYLKERYKDMSNVAIGYSGHEVGYIPTIVAATLGASIIERHFCLSRDSFVHHIECSLEPSEFAEMVEHISNLEQMKTTRIGLQVSEEKFLKEGSYSTQLLGNKSKI